MRKGHKLAGGVKDADWTGFEYGFSITFVSVVSIVLLFVLVLVLATLSEGTEVKVFSSLFIVNL